MTCEHCGVELTRLDGWGSIEAWQHPGGPCPKQTFLIAGEEFTLAEVQALQRVARAQLELEARRGRNG